MTIIVCFTRIES